MNMKPGDSLIDDLSVFLLTWELEILVFLTLAVFIVSGVMLFRWFNRRHPDFFFRPVEEKHRDRT
jgi:hypothetical protein